MSAFWQGFYKQAALPGVACVAVLDGDKILMGRRRDSKKWTNPGGHLNPGEKPMNGAIRELKEEAGIECTDMEHLVSKAVTTPTGKRLMIHAFVCKHPGGGTSMKEDPDQEVERWQWLRLPLDKEVLDNLHSPKNVLLEALGLQKKAEPYENEKVQLEHRRMKNQYVDTVQEGL